MVRNRHATTIQVFPALISRVTSGLSLPLLPATNTAENTQATVVQDGLAEAAANFNVTLAALENNRPDEAITQIKSVIPQLPEQPAVWRNLPVACRTQVAPSGSGDDVVIEFDRPDVPLPDGWIRDFVMHNVG